MGLQRETAGRGAMAIYVQVIFPKNASVVHKIDAFYNFRLFLLQF